MDHLTFAQILGNYGEFVGAIAVVVTLLYLATQIRQNTRTTLLNRGEAAVAQYNRVHEKIVADRELADLVARCRNPVIEGLTPGDEERLRRIALLYVNTFAVVEEHYRRGELDAEIYEETYCEDMVRTMREYPAIVPLMRSTVGIFERYRQGIFEPLFDERFASSPL